MKTYYRVIYGDTDAMKIVYNANYLHFFERGRNEFLRQLGFPYAELVEKNGLQLPLAESHVQYKKPAKYDDLLEIRSMVLELKNASVVIGYEIYNKDTGELLVTGSTKHAFVDMNMKPVALRKHAPELNQAIRRFMESGGIGAEGSGSEEPSSSTAPAVPEIQAASAGRVGVAGIGRQNETAGTGSTQAEKPDETVEAGKAPAEETEESRTDGGQAANLRFVTSEDKIVYQNAEGTVLAEIDFPAVSGDTVDISHTEVDGSLQGQGIAGKLTQLAAEHLKAEKKKIITSCSYAKMWFEQHPEYQDLLVGHGK